MCGGNYMHIIRKDYDLEQKGAIVFPIEHYEIKWAYGNEAFGWITNFDGEYKATLKVKNPDGTSRFVDVDLTPVKNLKPKDYDFWLHMFNAVCDNEADSDDLDYVNLPEEDDLDETKEEWEETVRRHDYDSTREYEAWSEDRGEYV